jgi:hypothetical protein
MTPIINVDRPQSERLRSTLERTFAFAQELGLVAMTDSTWRYRDQEHLLIYHPTTQEFQFINTQTDENLYWCNDILTGNFQPTANHWAEFQELSEWLDTQGAAPSVDIGSMPPPAIASPDLMAATAAQLFEYYASQEVLAYKLSEDSTIHYYSVAVDGLTYRLSRDDATGAYNLQRAETELDVQSHQSITPRDVEIWLEIEQWLAAQIATDFYPEDFDWDLGLDWVSEEAVSDPASKLKLMDFDR